MTTILSRLSRLGVWGIDDLNSPSFLGEMKSYYILPMNATALDWEKCQPYGKHPYYLNNDEGCLGGRFKWAALDAIHGAGEITKVTLDDWVGFIAHHQLPEGGWPLFFYGSVRPELLKYRDVYTLARTADDNSLVSMIEALACAAAYYEREGDTAMRDRCIGIAEKAMSAHLGDYNRLGGIPLFAHPVQHCPLPCRDHEGPWLSTDATAMFMWACAVMNAMRPSVIWRAAAKHARDTLEHMRDRDGQWYPHVIKRDSWTYRSVAYDEQFNIVHPSRGQWPDPANPGQYVTGVAPTGNPKRYMERLDAAKDGE